MLSFFKLILENKLNDIKANPSTSSHVPPETYSPQLQYNQQMEGIVKQYEQAMASEANQDYKVGKRHKRQVSLSNFQFEYRGSDGTVSNTDRIYKPPVQEKYLSSNQNKDNSFDPSLKQKCTITTKSNAPGTSATIYKTREVNCKTGRPVQSGWSIY